MAKKGVKNIENQYFEGEALRDWVAISISALSLLVMAYQLYLQKKQQK